MSRLFPFCLAHPLEGDPSALGPIADWQAEWKWDGIRGQLIRRQGRTFLWTRGEELVTERYPELAEIGPYLPDGTTIDGEILPWKDGRVLPFAMLQKRIGRKSLGTAILAEVLGGSSSRMTCSNRAARTSAAWSFPGGAGRARGWKRSSAAQGGTGD